MNGGDFRPRWGTLRAFLGGPVFKTRASTAGGVRLIPDWGTKLISHATQPKKKKKDEGHRVEAGLEGKERVCFWPWEVWGTC